MKRLAVVLLLAASAFAQTTRTWEQSRFEEFEKGTAKGVALRSDGAIELAPEFKPLATLPSTYLWAVGSDAAGNLFAAGGAPSRVYRVASSGEFTVLLAPAELQVQALAVARDGTIYAATSPDGKVYAIRRNEGAKASRPAADAKPSDTAKPNTPHVELDASYTSSVFFEPKTKYIWALAVDARGQLYVATGDRGQIFRVSPDGHGELFFASDEAHIRTIAFDRSGNLIAGSDGSGLIYRISPSGEGFVLYSAAKKEITALAIDEANNIYAAATGDKRERPAAPAVPVVIPVANPAAAAAQPAATPSATPVAPVPVPGLGAMGSEVYRIDADGSPRRLWASREDLVYALAFDHAGRLLAGTGNKGKVFVIGMDNRFTSLARATANQLIGFTKAPDGTLYAATSNLGKLFAIEDGGQREATFDSDVFDAHIFSRFGRAELRSRGNVELFVRSGNVDNPDRNWSPWRKVELTKNQPVDAPAARFLQWRLVLHSGTPAPEVARVAINYLPRNIAPEVDEVAVQVGMRVQPVPRLTADVASQASGSARADAMPPNAQRDREFVAVRWNAHDENEEPLTYSVFYRGDGETRWQLLKSGLADRYYSFESALLPDGGYTILVVASDAPTHAPSEALTGSRESARFEVDNTPPVIDGLAASIEGGTLHLSFRATDGFSTIRRAEFSLDAGEWQFVAPIGGLSDSRSASYDFTAALQQRTVAPVATAPEAPAEASSRKPKAQPGTQAVSGLAEEHILVVRVWDRYDNLATARLVLRPAK